MKNIDSLTQYLQWQDAQVDEIDSAPMTREEAASLCSGVETLHDLCEDFGPLGNNKHGLMAFNGENYDPTH